MVHIVNLAIIDEFYEPHCRLPNSGLDRQSMIKCKEDLSRQALRSSEPEPFLQSLEERLSAARQVAQGMQQLHRTPPPPPPRMVRPALPPPLDTATVQRYLAQTGLGAVNRPPKTSPRNG